MENFVENSEPVRFRGTTVYKPNNQGTGSALAFDARLPGGVFLGISTQVAGTKVQDSRFDWEQKVSCKFGFPDLQRFILAREAVRLRGLVVPTRWRPKGEGVEFSVGAFHRPPAGGSMVWQYDFAGDEDGAGGIFKLSKQTPDGVVTKRSVALDLGEEWLLSKFFETVTLKLLEVGG